MAGNVGNFDEAANIFLCSAHYNGFWIAAKIHIPSVAMATNICYMTITSSA
jgi:hypothetical protein